MGMSVGYVSDTRTHFRNLDPLVFMTGKKKLTLAREAIFLIYEARIPIQEMNMICVHQYRKSKKVGYEYG